MKTLILGITGVIGSGKSTVCGFLHETFGFHHIEADQIVRELYEYGKPGYNKVREYFGESFVGKSGVHRGRLRNLIMKSPQKIWILNKLMHPLVFQEMNKKIVQFKKAGTKEKGTLLICVEAIYFEDADLGKYVDKIFVIRSSPAVVKNRLKKRGIPMEQLDTLYKFQRRSVPFRGIDIENNGTLAALEKKVADAVSGMLQ